jgi:NAD(P)-dependent dehydrogenase (short-subunit alcohol dehydrogenase family)
LRLSAAIPTARAYRTAPPLEEALRERIELAKAERKIPKIAPRVPPMKYYGGMPRLALPQELGGAYVYLLSDTATYTTGIDIPIACIVGAW